jgi:hypothetical protein
MMYGEDQTWPMFSNLLRGYCTSLSESLSLCGIPLPIPSSPSDSDEPLIFYDRSPSPEFNSMSSRIGEQAWFTSQSEAQVQAQPQPRKRMMPLLDLDEEDEVCSSGEQDGESEAERRSRVLSEFQAETDIGLNPPSPSPSPSPSLSHASSSNPFLTPQSPSSPINHTSPSPPPNHSSSAWQTAELNELKRVCLEEGCGEEIAKESISEGDYERIAKGMNNSYWWQMHIPTVRKPREYTGENVVGGVEALRG